MALDDIRKKNEKDSPEAKAFRKPATKRKVIGYSLFGVASAGFAIWLFASSGNGMGAMVPLVVAMVAFLVAYDAWRQLPK